jgi:hypothetical protein
MTISLPKALASCAYIIAMPLLIDGEIMLFAFSFVKCLAA